MLTINSQSYNARDAYINLKEYANNVNNILKEHEIKKIDIALKATHRLIQNKENKVSSNLTEKYADLLYKKEILQDSSSRIIKIINSPIEPTSHIKPKRALIITLGFLLGCMLAVASLLIREALVGVNLESERVSPNRANP